MVFIYYKSRQNYIKKIAHENGFHVEIEKEVLNARKIHVVNKNGLASIAIEISVINAAEYKL